jgi:hypothetical protein
MTGMIRQNKAYIYYQKWMNGGGWYTINYELKPEYDYILVPMNNYLVLSKYDYIEADHGEEYFPNEKFEDIPDDRKMLVDFEFKPHRGGLLHPNLNNQIFISFSSHKISINDILKIEIIIFNFFNKFLL